MAKHNVVPLLTIGKLSAVSNISPDALRYYEREGLITPTDKTEGGYRLYGDDVVRRVRFIQHAQACGFSLAEIRELLQLRQMDNASCSDVRQRAIKKRLQIAAKIRTMQAMAETLDRMIAECVDEEKNLDACPILAALEKIDSSEEQSLGVASAKPVKIRKFSKPGKK